MDIKISGKQLDIGQALQQHVQDNVTTTISKYFDKALSATVTFAKEAGDIRCDIHVNIGTGTHIDIIGSHVAIDAYAALDGALTRMGKQLRRYKRRLTDHHRNAEGHHNLEFLTAKQYVIAVDQDNDEQEAADNPAIIAELNTQIETLSVSDAVMRLDLANRPALIFKNSKSGGLNVVYRRDDGNIGWIDPAMKTA
jgi:ribosomal subunit interface protein